MNYLSTDHLIVYTFLLVTLLVGLWAGRGVKDIRDYAIANKMYGTGVLTITLLATWIGGTIIMGELRYIFNDGIIMSVAVAFQAICMVFLALFIAPRMALFEGSLTMGDVMANLYGRYGQTATGIIGLIYAIFTVSAQILALSYVFESLLDLKGHWATSLVGLITILYAARGGMRGVAITDVLQFVVLIIVIPMIANAVLYEIGGVKELFAKLPTEKLQITGHKKLGYYTNLAFLCTLSPYLSSPPFISRMLMARNKKQAANMLFTGAAFISPFRFLIMIIGLSAFILYPKIDPNKIMPHVINEFFPIGLRGFCIAGLIAVIMSTADSFLHAAGLSLAHDVIKPFRISKGIGTNEIRWVQYGTFFIGCLAVALALKANNIRTMITYGNGIMMASITIPFLAGVMGLKTDVRSFRIALLVSIPTFFAANLFFSKEISHWVSPITLLVNALSFFGAHVVQNGGFAIAKSGKSKGLVWKPTWDSFSRRLPTFQNLILYSKERVAKYGASPTLFALFVSFNYMVPLFMHSCDTPATYGWIMIIKSIGALLCVSLLLEPYWPTRLTSYFPLFYHFSLMYCLPFVTTFLFLLEGARIEWLLNVALSIILLITLADWLTFVVLSVLGVTLAMIVYKLGIGPLVVSMDIDTKYTLFYAVAFSTLIGLLFARRKEQKIEKKQRLLINKDAASQTQLLRTAEERFRTLEEIKNIGPQNLLQIAKDLQSLPLKEGGVELLHSIEARLIPLAFQMQSIDTKSQDYLRLQITAVPIQQWITNLKKQLEGYVSQPIDCRITTQHREFCCDPDWITTLIVRSVALLQHQVQDNIYKDQESLLLGIEDTLLSYRLPDVAKDYVKQVKALRILITTEDELPSVETHYWPDLTTSQAASATTTRALTEQEIRRIVKAHYGYVHLEEHMLCCVVPVDLKEVRPRDVDKNHMELGIKPIRANDHYKSGQLDAQAQEKAFLSAVKKHSNADVGLVKKALELIKWYHGPVHRHSGEPFYLHPLAVAQIVLDYNTDQQTILGALLHDTVEDTWMFLQHIKTVFGQDTAQVVGLVTHLQSIPGSIYKVKLSVSENLQMLERSGSKQALYVKLADRVHNMRTINGHSSYAKKEQIAEETLQFFVPLAEKLGLREAAEELKELCKRVS